MVLRATPVARAVAAMAGAVRLRGHVQSPRPLIKRRTNRFEPQRNGFLVDHPTTLSGSWRGENHPTPRGSYRRAYFWASPKLEQDHECSLGTIRDSIRTETWRGRPLITVRGAGQARLTDSWFSGCANTGLQAGPGDS